MAINPYEMLRLVIARGGYDKTDILRKLEAYHAAERITDEQYQELKGKIGGAEE